MPTVWKVTALILAITCEIFWMLNCFIVEIVLTLLISIQFYTSSCFHQFFLHKTIFFCTYCFYVNKHWNLSFGVENIFEFWQELGIFTSWIVLNRNLLKLKTKICHRWLEVINKEKRLPLQIKQNLEF